jgi:hypothetical protein
MLAACTTTLRPSENGIPKSWGSTECVVWLADHSISPERCRPSIQALLEGRSPEDARVLWLFAGRNVGRFVSPTKVLLSTLARLSSAENEPAFLSCYLVPGVALHSVACMMEDGTYAADGQRLGNDLLEHLRAVANATDNVDAGELGVNHITRAVEAFCTWVEISLLPALDAQAKHTPVPGLDNSDLGLEWKPRIMRMHTGVTLSTWDLTPH